MANGQYSPTGLQAVKTLNGASWNGQVNPYFINTNTGATQASIFRGDPVVMSSSGYILSLWDPQVSTPQTTPILGVFDGCSYQNTAANNPIDPANPGRPYWPVGTPTPGNVAAVANIIDDPNTVFIIQTNQSGAGAGLTQTNVGGTYQLASGTGNTTTGISTTALDQTGGSQTSATNPVKMLRLVDNVQNVSGAAYNDGEFIIQNHFYCSRPGGV